MLVRSQLGLCDVCLQVAFLHPNCHKKGGGERVLWLAVQAMYADP